MPVRDPKTGRFVSSGSSMISTEVKGLEETKRKLEQVAEDLHGKPMVSAMEKATLLVVRAAKKNLSSPYGEIKFPTVDLGQLRNSITPEVYSQRNILKGVVGSNVKHAPYMELGTGVFAGRPPHAPPIKALKIWTEHKNRGGKHLNPYVVQLAIKKRGGLRPRKYLQRAVDDNREQINKILEDGVHKIIIK